MRIARLSLLACLALLAASHGYAAAEEPNTAVYRVHMLRYLDPDLAQDLVQQRCTELGRTCRVDKVEPTHLVVAGSESNQVAIAAYLADIDVPPKVYQFQVTLVRAYSGTAPANRIDVPPNLARALDELKAFLPYKAYEVADIGWIRTVSDGETALTAAGKPYIARLRLRAAAKPGQGLMADHFELVTNIDFGNGSSSMRPVVSGSFPIKLGETVVVGASKFLGGGDAIVVLLTAVSPQS
ncbi:MAG: hypothetical protein KBD01_18365 [Acidobacteria bacterium]|nr:hypothetical protein [Acidobacteriota bacterium]